MQGQGILVATAGHIDHGKSALVHALTGVDPDTLPEERARGITIALGHATLELPDGRRIAFVDVPGHERLVRTMAAGAHGVDAALLIVAADDGVMPQTREHLAIVELLGVPAGAVVLTKADLASPDLIELVCDDVADLVQGTVLEGAPVIVTSARDGQGLDALRDVLATLPGRARPADGPFRLPVDRAFTRPGFGTVVTGTALGGRLADGATVRVLPDEVRARVRGIQVHGDDVDEAGAGQRVALNLTGVDLDQVGRGAVIAQGDVPCPSIVDVAYRHTSAAVDLDDGMAVRVLVGTAERLGRVHLTGDDAGVVAGERAWAQLRLDAPVPVLPGDRFVLRRVSPVDTLGGGRVLDPWARRMRRADRERCATQLERLEAGDASVWLERADEEGIAPDAWAARPGSEGVGVVLGDRVFAPAVVARLEGRLAEALATFHTATPLALGAPRRELKAGRLAHLGDRVFDALLDRLAGRGIVALDGPLVRAEGFQVALSDDEAALADALRATVTGAGVGGIDVSGLREQHASDAIEALLRLLERDGHVLKVPDLGWVATATAHAVRDQLQGWFAGHDDPLTPADFRDAHGLSRRTTLPWLAWTDAQGWTRRGAEGREAGPSLGGGSPSR